MSAEQYQNENKINGTFIEHIDRSLKAKDPDDIIRVFLF
jgi:hypothetical protein